MTATAQGADELEFSGDPTTSEPPPPAHLWYRDGDSLKLDTDKYEKWLEEFRAKVLPQKDKLAARAKVMKCLARIADDESTAFELIEQYRLTASSRQDDSQNRRSARDFILLAGMVVLAVLVLALFLDRRIDRRPALPERGAQSASVDPREHPP